RHRAIWFPPYARRRHVLGVGVDAKRIGTVKALLARNQRGPAVASHKQPPSPLKSSISDACSRAASLHGKRIGNHRASTQSVLRTMRILRGLGVKKEKMANSPGW